MPTVFQGNSVNASTPRSCMCRHESTPRVRLKLAVACSCNAFAETPVKPRGHRLVYELEVYRSACGGTRVTWTETHLLQCVACAWFAQSPCIACVTLASLNRVGQPSVVAQFGFWRKTPLHQHVHRLRLLKAVLNVASSIVVSQFYCKHAEELGAG